MCILKTKHRNRLEVEADLRLCLSTVSPRFQKLTDGKQAQIFKMQLLILKIFYLLKI